MLTSTSNVFGRVNRRRPRRICGKPDWRSYVRRDGERISICMRVSDGARKINRNGGAIFIHDDQLLQKILDQFPGAGSLRGIPGFWEDGQGTHLWKSKDYLLPRLLIPVRDGSGRIHACQMRLPLATKKGLRYLWLSSSDLPHGTGSGSPLHFKFRLADLPRAARIVIVEGVLKAGVLYAIRPELYIVATPCVTANHRALVELTHGRHVLTAFDQDFYENEAVCFHLASLIARRLRRERTLATTGIASWDASVKGIDDAVVRNLPITSISVQRWLDRLSPRFQQIAMARLSEITEISLSARNRRGRKGNEWSGCSNVQSSWELQ